MFDHLFPFRSVKRIYHTPELYVILRRNNSLMDDMDNEKTLHDEAKHIQKFEDDYEMAKEKKK